MLKLFVRRGAGVWCALAAILLAACGSNPDRSTFTPAGGGGDAGANGASGSDAGYAGTVISYEGGALPDGAPITNALALAFDPPSAHLDSDGTTTPVATFKLMATLLDGTTSEVPAESLQFDRPDLGTAAAGPPITVTATGTLGGVGKLHGIFGGLEAIASVEVSVRERDTGSVAANVVTALDAVAGGAADASVSPTDPLLTTLLYPYDQTVFPLGLASPLVMWNAPNPSGDSYKLHLEVAHYAYDLYANVNALGQLRIPQVAWERVTASSVGIDDKLQVVLSRWDAAGQKAFVSAQQTWPIAPASLRGAIYYWTASQASPTAPRVGSIVRIRPGTGATFERLNEGRCMGCHSVSADGTTLVATIEDLATAPSVAPFGNWSGTRPWGAFALPAGTLTKLTTMAGGNSALTPDGKYVVFGGRSNPVVSGAKYIELGETATGNLVSDSGLDALVPENGSYGFMMPAFSMDGSKLALVEAGGDLGDNVLPSPSNRIVYIGFDASKPVFDTTIHSVVRADAMPAAPDASPSDASLGNRGLGYPSFTPDGKWIAFHTGPWSTGCHDGCLDSAHDAGELWMAPVEPSGPPIRLARLNDPPAKKDHYLHREPTFNPKVRGGFAWVVFTSMRDWGNDLVSTEINGNRRLWVAAIDADVAATDPSHPAFYLEGQNNDEPNMRGFWVNAACIETPKPGETGGACTAGFECCSGFCVGGKCADQSVIACKGSGESCTTDADCCNQGSMLCTDGVCQVKPPIR